jgi:hypothetical protein
MTHVIALAGALCAGFWALARLLLAQFQRSIDERFATINTALASSLRTQDENQRRIERDLMDLKVALPRDYVRREDHTQHIATIMTKIDALAMRMETLFLRAIDKEGARE